MKIGQFISLVVMIFFRYHCNCGWIEFDTCGNRSMAVESFLPLYASSRNGILADVGIAHFH